MRGAIGQEWRNILRPVMSRLVDSRDLSGFIMLLFQKVWVQQKPETSSPVLRQNDKVEEAVSEKKKRKLTDGSSSGSPAPRPPGPSGGKTLPPGVSWTKSKMEVIGPPFFFPMSLFFSSTVLFCSGFLVRRGVDPVLRRGGSRRGGGGRGQRS